MLLVLSCRFFWVFFVSLLLYRLLMLDSHQFQTTAQYHAGHMLDLVAVTVGLLIIIMCFSKGLKQVNKPSKSQPIESSGNGKMKDLSEEDVHLLARILSVGLVDADPNYLHHLKGYRDLHAG